MRRIFQAIFLLTALFVGAQAKAQDPVTLEQFGGGCGYAIDNTAAMFGATNSYRATLATNGLAQLQLKPCDYWFQTCAGVAPFDTVAPNILGMGRFASRMVLNCELSAGQPFIGAIGVKGASFRGFSLSRTTGGLGVMLAIRSTAALDASQFSVEDIIITSSLPSPASSCGCWFERGLEINGTARNTGAMGARTSDVRNVHVFGVASDVSVLIEGAVGLAWEGGGVYSGGMRVGRTGQIAKNNYLYIALANINGDLNLQQCSDCNIFSTVVAGSLANTSEAITTFVHGRVSGAVQSNWPTPSALLPY